MTTPTQRAPTRRSDTREKIARRPDAGRALRWALIMPGAAMGLHLLLRAMVGSGDAVVQRAAGFVYTAAVGGLLPVTVLAAWHGLRRQSPGPHAGTLGVVAAVALSALGTWILNGGLFGWSPKATWDGMAALTLFGAVPVLYGIGIVELFGRAGPHPNGRFMRMLGCVVFIATMPLTFLCVFFLAIVGLFGEPASTAAANLAIILIHAGYAVVIARWLAPRRTETQQVPNNVEDVFA